jgi:hypothetical protein
MINSDDNLVAYCGLCCEDCPNYQGKLAKTASLLIDELKQFGLKDKAQALAEYPEFSAFAEYPAFEKLLKFMTCFQCPRGYCRAEGESHCQIVHCCREKQYEGCWQCSEFEDCDKMGFLKAIHKDAHLKNMRIIKEKGIKEFLKGQRNW